jgi:hypothetical protein
MKCWNCGSERHFKNNCPQLRSNNSREWNKDKERNSGESSRYKSSKGDTSKSPGRFNKREVTFKKQTHSLKNSKRGEKGEKPKKGRRFQKLVHALGAALGTSSDSEAEQGTDTSYTTGEETDSDDSKNE